MKFCASILVLRREMTKEGAY